MTVEEAKSAIKQFEAQIKSEGYTDQKEIDMQILATLGGMFIEDEIDVKQLNALMKLVGDGYELPEEFLAMSTEEQKANFFEESEDGGEENYSEDEVKEIEEEVVNEDKSKNNKGSVNDGKETNEDEDETEEDERKRAEKLFGM